MKRTLTLLVASTALTAAIGLPAWSAMHMPRDGGSEHSFAAVFDVAREAAPLHRVSDDDDDDERGGFFRRGDDDDDGKYRKSSRHDDDDDDEEDDDDDDGRGNARNPAPAGTVAPPQNGLFGTGAAPKVKMN